MKDKEYGGFAFPRSGSNCSPEVGMTLRDWFAGLAMAAKVITLGDHFHEGPGGVAECDENVARRAYERADALIAERSKR